MYILYIITLEIHFELIWYFEQDLFLMIVVFFYLLLLHKLE